MDDLMDKMLPLMAALLILSITLALVLLAMLILSQKPWALIQE